MAESDSARRVDLEDLTAAAIAGVSRALAARGVKPKSPFHFPIWVGFIANPDWGEMPWPTPTEPQDEPPIPLTMRDHTLIMEAAIRQAVPLLKNLGLSRDRTTAWTPDDALRALRKITASDEVRDSVSRALQWRKIIADADQRMDQDTNVKVRKLMESVRGADSVEGKLRVLKDAQARAGADEEAFAAAVGAAATMLQLGRATIYNPDFYADFLGGGEDTTAMAKGAAGEITDADIEGGVSGGVTGGLVGLATPAGPISAGAGAAIGAAAGAIGNSLGKAVTKFIDWLF